MMSLLYLALFALFYTGRPTKVEPIFRQRQITLARRTGGKSQKNVFFELNQNKTHIQLRL